MKKILAALLVLALVAPAMADVAITATDNGSQQLKISFAATGGAVVRGIAVKLTVTGGQVASYVAASSAFNTFVDQAFTTGSGYTIGSGSPLANPAAAGVATLPAASASVSTGYLDQAGAQAGLTTGNVAIVQLSGIANNTIATVAIVADTLRGGAVVGDNLGNVTVQASQTVAGPVVVASCRDRLPALEQAEFDKYIAAGYTVADMAVWCNRFQCRGDYNNAAEGASWVVYSTDLNGLIANWKLKVTAKAVNPAADFDHFAEGASWRVYSNDLNTLIANWKGKATTLTNCPGYVAP